MLGRLGGWLLSERAEPLLARLPAGRAKAGTDPSLGAWAPYRRTVPTSLQSTPGIRRDREAEDRAHATEPLHDFHALHGPAITWILKQHWHLLAPRLPRMARVALRERATARVTPASAAPACDPARGSCSTLRSRSGSISRSIRLPGRDVQRARRRRLRAVAEVLPRWGRDPANRVYLRRVRRRGAQRAFGWRAWAASRTTGAGCRSWTLCS